MQVGSAYKSSFNLPVVALLLSPGVHLLHQEVHVHPADIGREPLLMTTSLVEAKPSLASLPFGAVHSVGTVSSPTKRYYGEYNACYE